MSFTHHAKDVRVSQALTVVLRRRRAFFERSILSARNDQQKPASHRQFSIKFVETLRTWQASVLPALTMMRSSQQFRWFALTLVTSVTPRAWNRTTRIILMPAILVATVPIIFM